MKKHEEVSNSIYDGITRIEAFKKDIIVDLQELDFRTTLLKQKFLNFFEQEENELNGKPLLFQGYEHYEPLCHI